MFLPVELVARILSFLSFKDIVICSGLSRHFLELVKTSIVLQYIIELGLHGLVDSGHGNMSTAERLSRLREREDGWSTLDWQHSYIIPVGRKYIFWELCGGIFAGSYRSQSDSPFGPRSFDLIDIFELEPIVDIGPAKTIVLESRYCNFTIDPGQDILVLVKEPPHMPKLWIMHIRKLSDASAHPDAAHEMLEVPMAHETWRSNGNGSGIVEIQILGSVVLFCQRRGPGLSGSIAVFNWITGDMTLMIYPTLGDWCGSLISEDHLLLAQRPSFRSQPCLELYNTHPPSKWDAARITYLLPFGSDENWRAKTHYGPASYSCTTAAAGARRPFVPTRQPLLLAFRFTHHASSGISSLDMFVIPSKLLGYQKTSNVVKWEEWGPGSTRWFKAVLPNKWQRNIQGYRAILPEQNTVLDFNPNIWTEGEDGVVCQPSHVPSGVSGSNSIVSALPYRMIQPREAFESSNILLDEHLVCVETDPHNLGMVQAFRVLSF